jgi:hypothetical protein
MAKYGSDMPLPLFDDLSDITLYLRDCTSSLRRLAMSTTSKAPPQKTAKPLQPAIWVRYVQHAECPISFCGSALLHALALCFIVLIVVWGAAFVSENSKPPQMDVVDVEGLGGRLGGIGEGPGGDGPAEPKRTDVARVADNPNVIPNKVADTPQLPELPKFNINVAPTEDSPNAIAVKVFDDLDRQQQLGKQILEAERKIANANPRATGGTGGVGGTGGPKGPGVGNKQGPGAGKGTASQNLTDQRRRELRWKILASDDGDIHLKKLQALKAVLIIPLQSKPGFMMRYDLSKPVAQVQMVPIADDPNKVRWKNGDPKQMMGLAKALGLSEVPQFSVIYLPTELEKDMARRELAHKGLREADIALTIWDLRIREGLFDNEPYIVTQEVRPGIR